MAKNAIINKFVASAIIIFLAGLLLRLFLSFQIYSGDVNNHINWARDALTNGFGGMYERDLYSRYGTEPLNYPPLPVFLFTVFLTSYNWLYQTAWHLNLTIPEFPSGLIFFLEDQDTLPAFLKFPVILADLGIAFLVFLFAKKLVGVKSRIPLIASSLVLFNPAFFYNSAFWGQIEALPLFFVLLSFYFLLFSNKLYAVLFFALALLSKQTAIVFLPVFVFCFLRNFNLQALIKGMITTAVLFWLFFLPFYRTGNLLTFPFLTYWNKIQFSSVSDYASDHAFNFWAITVGLGKVSDSTLFLGISYYQYGLVVFVLLVGLIVYLLSKKTDLPNIILANSLVAFAAFLFLTRIHERHLEATLPFVLLAGVKNKAVFIIFLVVSVVHTANLYHNWWFPRIDFFVSVFSQETTVNLLTSVLIGTFLFLLVQYIKKRQLDED